MTFQLTKTTVALIAVMGLAGCSDDGGDTTDPDKKDGGDTPAAAQNTDVGGDVEIFSWWTSGGEEDALNAMLAVHKERVPEAEVTNAAVDFADKAREQLQDRMEQGLPPETFQVNIGQGLMKWVLFSGDDDSDTKVENLQPMAEALGWDDALDPDIAAAASFDGKLYAVPVNVHRINSLFYRKDLFEKHGLEVPTTLAELEGLCERIMTDEDIQADAPSGRMACMGLGNKWNWTLSLLTFEMLLPSIGGAATYQSFFRGELTAGEPAVIQSLEATLKFYCGGDDTSNCLKTSWFNSDVDEVTWDVGVQKMADGDAMMAPMGDWAKGFLQSDAGGNLVPGQDFDVVAFPGSEGTFVFTSDTFPLPKGVKNRDGARSLLRTFASKEGQIAFNELKGSIPARTDIDATEFDVVTQGVIASFASSEKAIALSGLISGDALPDLAPELKASVQDGSIDIVKKYLEANYASLD